jgi:hypothetical protein
MGLWLRIALLLPVAALLGCGAGPSAPPNLTGNWMMIGSSESSLALTGYLQSSNGTVTGILEIYGSFQCDSGQPLAVSGTVNGSGNLILTVPLGDSLSTPGTANGTATITAALGSNLESPTTGSYQIMNGACAISTSPMTITQYAPVNGTYAGSVRLFGGTPNETNITFTAALVQSATPNAEGQFPLSGTVTATGDCTASGPLATFAYVAGNLVWSPSLPLVIGTIDPGASAITGRIVVGSCVSSPTSAPSPVFTRQ